MMDGFRKQARGDRHFVTMRGCWVMVSKMTDVRSQHGTDMLSIAGLCSLSFLCCDSYLETGLL